MLPEFRLERWFALYEFQAPYILASSDCQSMTINDLISLEPQSDLSKLTSVWLGYTETQGSPTLRDQISSLYSSIDKDQVLVYAGAEEGIFSFANSVLASGDHVIVEWPCYQSLAECPKSIGCEVTPWKLRENVETNTWHLDLNELEALIQPNRTRAVIINSPHNPTGFTLNTTELERIVSLCRQHNLYLFSDEVYRGLERAPFVAAPAACDLYENAISLGVMSKAYGLAGLRIGWIATKNTTVRAALSKYKDYVSICNSAPSEFLAEVALTKRGTILERNNRIINDNIKLLQDFFDKHQDTFVWSPPVAGCIAFVQLKGSRSSLKFCQDLVEKQGVLLLPSVFFDESDDSHFRLGFGRENLAQGLVQLEQYLNNLNNRL